METQSVTPKKTVMVRVSIKAHEQLVAYVAALSQEHERSVSMDEAIKTLLKK